MSTPLAQARRAPIVIYRSVNREGETYALESRSLQRLREELGAAVHSHPRVFIAHESRADYEAIHSSIVPQVIQLLTGISEEKLRELGGVTFRDPVTEEELRRQD